MLRNKEEIGRPLSNRPWDQVKAATLSVPAGPAWYFVRCVGRSDAQAIESLRDMKFEVYYPKILEMQPVPKRKLSAAQRISGVEIKKPQQIPLFPRYVMTRFDIQRSGWRDMFNFAGVGGLVCKNAMPARIDDALVVSIKGRENNGAVPGSASIRILFDVGDEVTVTAGPFASFPGIVESVLDTTVADLDPEARIKVAVNIFGRPTPVELELWQVAKH